jgi:hypothetical protein
MDVIGARFELDSGTYSHLTLGREPVWEALTESFAPRETGFGGLCESQAEVRTASRAANLLRCAQSAGDTPD